MNATDHHRQSYFEAIVEAFDGMVYVCSPDNRIEFVNRQVLEQLGVTRWGGLPQGPV